MTSVATISDCWVISGSWYHQIKIWDLRRPFGKYCTDTVDAHTQSITTIEVLEDRCFYSGSFDNTVTVWRLTQEGKAFLKHILFVGEPVTCLKVLPGGQLFAGTLWGRMKFWEATKADEAPLTKTWRAFCDGKVECIELLPNGLLLTHSSKNAIKVWKFNQPEVTTLAFPCMELSFRDVVCSAVSPEGQVIISLKSAKMEIFTFKNHNTHSVYTKKMDDSCITSIAFLQDGRMITGFVNGVVKIWDYPDSHHPKQP